VVKIRERAGARPASGIGPGGLRRDRIAGVVLAGGEGRRIGGDKPFRLLNGRPLIEHVVERMRPQVGALWISTRGNGSRLADFGKTIEDDLGTGLAGPVAGVLAALGAAAAEGFPAVAIVPCDAPLVPRNLVPRLAEALAASDAPGVVIATRAGLQPTFALWRVAAYARLRNAATQGPQLRRVCHEVGVAVLDCDEAGFNEAAFGNVNSRRELDEVENWIAVQSNRSAGGAGEGEKAHERGG